MYKLSNDASQETFCSHTKCEGAATINNERPDRQRKAMHRKVASQVGFSCNRTKFGGAAIEATVSTKGPVRRRGLRWGVFRIRGGRGGCRVKRGHNLGSVLWRVGKGEKK